MSNFWGRTLFLSSMLFVTIAWADTAPVVDAAPIDAAPSAEATPAAADATDLAMADTSAVESSAPAEKNATVAALGKPSTDKSDKSNLSTEARLTILERQLNNLISMDPVGKSNALQQQVAALQGQLEVQSHQLQQLTEKTQSQYQDLDQRLSPNAAGAKKSKEPSAEAHNVSGKTAAAGTAVAAGSAAATSESDPAAEQKAYQAANQLLKNRDYVRATPALQDFLSHYPNGQYAANAHFWLGEIYLRQNQPDQALSEFKTVIDQYPLSPKVPDAMLKLGFAYADKGDTAQARVQLEKVKKQFPGSSTAQLADARLQQLK